MRILIDYVWWATISEVQTLKILFCGSETKDFFFKKMYTHYFIVYMKTLFKNLKKLSI